MEIEALEREYVEAQQLISEIRSEIKKYIVGQETIVDEVLWSILAGGHVLLEGLPGLGKTMLIRTISEVLDLSYARIQFTPDLMPADITGTNVLQTDEIGKQHFHFHEGPLFHHIVLADEINRATPKTQSALLEAMGEKTVTIMGKTKVLEAPFFVLATQNPLDMEGTYPLPEAQLDRFLCKLIVPYPSRAELKEIIVRTSVPDERRLNKIADRERILHLQYLAKKIIIAEDMLEFAVDIVASTHIASEDTSELCRKYLAAGSGPRGLQSLVSMAKARALSLGRYHVSIADVKYAALPVLRHRLLLNFEGEMEGIKIEDIVVDIIQHVENREAGKQR